MSSHVHSITDAGQDGVLIDVECHISNGLPNIVIVGFANKAVDEAKERIRSAFASSSMELPRKRITINLAPADLPKDGTSFDLAMSAAILTSSGQIPASALASAVVVGELGLDGSIRPIRGIIGKLLAARARKVSTFYIPIDNLAQAQLIPNITLIPVQNLRDLYMHATGTVVLPMVVSGEFEESDRVSEGPDFKHITGQQRAKRAIEIAAAGGHNILLSGPPGTGKSMLAKATPSILPPLGREETLEITQLHSLASRQYDQIIRTRPFRAPHHSASGTSILGGGTNPRPGEISLSHRGVLFFDELPEYSRATLEALRQPLEDKVITVARAKDSITFPANFMLIATCNPCPCGFYGTSKACSCLPQQIINYQRKLSGPILDRIDLFVEVDEIAHATLLNGRQEEPSTDIARRVKAAHQRQTSRFGAVAKTNANLTNQDIKQHASLSPPALDILNQAAEKLGISARAYMRIIKVARTIADLAESQSIEVPHITEALQYRRPSTTI